MGEQNSSALPFHFLGLTRYLTGQMQAITRKRLLRVANEAKTLASVRRIASELFEQHEQMNLALKKRDISSLSHAIRGSQKAVESLRFVLGLKRQA